MPAEERRQQRGHRLELKVTGLRCQTAAKAGTRDALELLKLRRPLSWGETWTSWARVRPDGVAWVGYRPALSGQQQPSRPRRAFPRCAGCVALTFASPVAFHLSDSRRPTSPAFRIGADAKRSGLRIATAFRGGSPVEEHFSALIWHPVHGRPEPARSHSPCVTPRCTGSLGGVRGATEVVLLTIHAEYCPKMIVPADLVLMSNGHRARHEMSNQA